MVQGGLAVAFPCHQGVTAGGTARGPEELAGSLHQSHATGHATVWMILLC